MMAHHASSSLLRPTVRSNEREYIRGCPLMDYMYVVSSSLCNQQKRGKLLGRLKATHIIAPCSGYIIEVTEAISIILTAIIIIVIVVVIKERIGDECC